MLYYRNVDEIYEQDYDIMLLCIVIASFYDHLPFSFLDIRIDFPTILITTSSGLAYLPRHKYD